VVGLGVDEGEVEAEGFRGDCLKKVRCYIRIVMAAPKKQHGSSCGK